MEAILNQAMPFWGWIQANLAIVILAGVVFIQYIGFQALLIHYTLFRKSLKKPRPDGLRFQQIEGSVAFNAEQIEKLFEKIAEIKKDLSNWTRPEPRMTTQNQVSSMSVESSYLSMGELQLKKKLEAFKSRTH